MGYNTDFRGTLNFQEELRATHIVKLQSILGEDCRDHPEWKVIDNLTYINLKLTDDYTGLEWDQCEKTYCMEQAIELILRLMQEEWPDFKGLTGEMLAQGEDIEDRYVIMVDGVLVTRRESPPDGSIVECPHCGEKFAYNASSL